MKLPGTCVTRSSLARANRRFAQRAGVIGVTAFAVMGTGVAFASWTANGTGSAASRAGTSVAVSASTATPSGAAADLLYPGLSAHLSVTITNNNPFSVKVSAISLAGAGAPSTVVSPANASCTTSTAHVSLAAGSVTGTFPLSIAANATVTFVSTSSPVSMLIDSDDGCQGATFTFPKATVAAAAG